MSIDATKLIDFWNFWMESLRTGPRVHVPLIGPLHQGVIDYLAPYWFLASLLLIAAGVVWVGRRRG